ncbi:MAG: HYR domain-containing protein [Saprospiraceae bacterium]|nr:HYR domain-containing protein [Saprospiraceae bacterium]
MHGNSAVCNASVTVLDTAKPSITCKNLSYNAGPGACEVTLNYLPSGSDNCDRNPTISVLPPYTLGQFLPIGIHNVCYQVSDAAGNTATCCSQINVIEFSGYIRELACNDEIQVSLDDSCKATITADMILEGGPYKCYDKYIVELRDWSTNVLIDRCTNQFGAQITCSDIGREIKVIIIDPETGNKCWGKAREDKLAPRMTCLPDTCVPCNSSIALQH